MAQTKDAGAPATAQLLTGNLDHWIIDEVDGANVINDFGTVGGNAEVLLTALSTLSNPVVIAEGNTRIMYVAVESNGVSTAAVAAAINATPSFANATVTAGAYTVV